MTSTAIHESPSDLGRSALLGYAAAAATRELEAARDKLVCAYAWAIANPASDETGAATWSGPVMLTRTEHLGGEGTPGVSAFAPDEFSAAIGVSPDAGLALLADALNLAHRLPTAWRLVQELRVPAWRARRLAQATAKLTSEHAGQVDESISHRLAQIAGSRLIDDTVARVVAESAPQEFSDAEELARESWDVTVCHPRATEFAGTSELHAIGDTADLTAFYAVVRDTADQLAQWGDTGTAGQRRAKSLGVIASRQAMLDLADTEDALAPTARRSTPSGDPAAFRKTILAKPDARRAAQVLYLHLDASHVPDLVATSHRRGTGFAERLGPVTAGRIQDWVGEGSVIQPVIMMDTDTSVDSHDPPPWMREQIVLRDQTCRFPWCTRPARGCDLDHVDPYDDTGPPGQTRPSNLACLCRRHHRAKTAGVWRYRLLPDKHGPPGSVAFRWSSPSGHSYLVTTTGTTFVPRSRTQGPR